MPRPVYADGMAVGLVSRKEYNQQAKAEAAKVLDRRPAKAKSAGIDSKVVHVIDRRAVGSDHRRREEE